MRQKADNMVDFYVRSSGIYTLTAYLADTGGTEWLAIGYVEGTNVISGAGWHETSDNPVGWILAGVPGPSADYQDFEGPGTGGHHDGSIPNPAYSTLGVILDTRPVSPANWTFTWLVNGSVVDGPDAFGGSGPAIQGVGLCAQYGAGGIVSNFTLVEQYPPSAPYLVAQPVGGTYFVGDTISLGASAGGSDPLTYKWQKDSADIPGATAAMLVITNAAVTNSGNYQFFVHNPLGDTNSVVVYVQVVPVPAPSTIYQDTFSRPSAPLHGRTPDVAGAPIQWIAESDWTTDGTEAAFTNNDGNGGGNAWLPFVPKPNTVYALSADVEVLPVVLDGEWIALGFRNNTTPLTNTLWYNLNVADWILHREDGEPNYDDVLFVGPGTSQGYDTGVFSTGGTNLTVVLDTRPLQSANWTATILLGGTVVLPATPLGFTPNIHYVGFGAVCSSDPGTVKNFTLTAEVVPAPPLQIAMSHGYLTLSWSTSAAGYTLQSATNLAGPWQALGGSVNVGGTNQVTVTVGGTAQYFRLIR